MKQLIPWSIQGRGRSCSVSLDLFVYVEGEIIHPTWPCPFTSKQDRAVGMKAEELRRILSAKGKEEGVKKGDFSKFYQTS